MGYYANYEGYIRFKEAPTDKVIDFISDRFGDHDFDADGLGMSFYGYDKFYSDYTEESLYKIKDLITKGEVKYHGEDDSFWRYIYKDNKWVEEDGEICYNTKHLQKIEKQDITEFLGQIVDQFEDVVTEYSNTDKPVFTGVKYDKVITRLYLLMKHWKVF